LTHNKCTYGVQCDTDFYTSGSRNDNSYSVKNNLKASKKQQNRYIESMQTTRII